MKKLFILAIICAPLAGAYASENEQKVFPAAGLTSMAISAETGSVSVNSSSSGAVRVEIKDNDAQKCRLTAKIEGKELILKAEKIKEGSFLSDSNCHAGFDVSAPAALALDAFTGTGDVSISGRSADVTVKSGTGDVSVRSISGDLRVGNGTGSLTGDVCANNVRVDGGTGRVNLTGLCGSARVDTGTGSVALQWKKVPPEGEARVDTGVGSITMTFPREAQLNVKLDSGLGATKNEFENSGKFSVSADSGVGRISVLKEAK